jgi:hypothetical protein
MILDSQGVRIFVDDPSDDEDLDFVWVILAVNHEFNLTRSIVVKHSITPLDYFA